MPYLIMKLAFALFLLVLALPGSSAAEPPAPRDEPPHHSDDDATVEHGFENPEQWSERWDTAERDAWQEPEAVVAFLGLEGGETVADIGAGTGYFTVRLARAVGESGRVLAVDIAPEMLEFVEERARKEGLPQVETVLADADDPRLPDGRVDLILTVNTWHHINDRLDYLERLGRDLAPGGRLVIVDYREGELPVGPPVGHKISRDDLVSELERGGFELEDELQSLEHQYVLAFRPSDGR
jgi:ubiquinone/menaquinone biosynthesis C-methylase UbiE